MFCEHCGTQLREEAKFCHVCGAEQLSETYGGTCTLSSNPAVQMPTAMETKEEKNSAAKQDPPSEDSLVQPLNGTFLCENVKISGEFKNGVGTLTITFG